MAVIQKDYPERIPDAKTARTDDASCSVSDLRGVRFSIIWVAANDAAIDH